MSPEHGKGRPEGRPDPARPGQPPDDPYRATETTGAGDPMAPGQEHPQTPRPADDD